MKSVKKILAVLLSTAMLFAICAMSIFAAVISTYDKDYPKYNDNANYFYYAIEDDEIIAEGTLNYTSVAVTLTISCTNIDYYDITEYRMFAQCAVNYTDGSQDFFTLSRGELIAQGHDKATSDSFSLAAGKTVESFDAEFWVMYENETLWEGQIYEPLT